MRPGYYIVRGEEGEEQLVEYYLKTSTFDLGDAVERCAALAKINPGVEHRLYSCYQAFTCMSERPLNGP